MTHSYLMKPKELALLLRTSVQNINNQISRGLEGENVPPSLRIGKNRFWRSETVFNWLEEKENESKHNSQAINQVQTVGIRRA